MGQFGRRSIHHEIKGNHVSGVRRQGSAWSARYCTGTGTLNWCTEQPGDPHEGVTQLPAGTAKQQSPASGLERMRNKLGEPTIGRVQPKVEGTVKRTGVPGS